MSTKEFGDEIKSVDGRVHVSFDGDGGLTTEYLGWLLTAEAEGFTVTIARDGTDTGVYSATDKALTFQDTSIGSTLVLSGVIEMVIDPEPAFYANAAYACDAGTATISTTDGDLRLTRQ